MVIQEKTKVANVGRMNGGKELLVDLCIGSSRLLVQACVCLEMAGRATDSRCGAGNLPVGTQTQELPPDGGD